MHFTQCCTPMLVKWLLCTCSCSHISDASLAWSKERGEAKENHLWQTGFSCFFSPLLCSFPSIATFKVILTRNPSVNFIRALRFSLKYVRIIPKNLKMQAMQGKSAHLVQLCVMKLWRFGPHCVRNQNQNQVIQP